MASKYEILKNIPDKRNNKGTTTLRFKEDLIDFFTKNSKDNNAVIELGTHHGWSTWVLSHLFPHVMTFDNNEKSVHRARAFNHQKTNIVYYVEDIYECDWWSVSDNISAVFVDAVHSYECVILDIKNCLKIANECYIIFDDYGLFEDVKRAVDEYVESKKLSFVKYIGEPAGSDCRTGKVLQDWEGIICKKW